MLDPLSRPDEFHSPTFTVEELRGQTLTGVVQQQIEALILEGALKPGQRLNEQAIATRLSVSRGPIREACRALAELGLVYQIPNRGIFVKHLTMEEAEEVYDLRVGLIGLAASLLAPRVDAAIGARLEAYLTQMDDAVAQADYSGSAALNIEFHDYIVQSTRNSRLVKLYRGLVKEFRLFRSYAPATGEVAHQSNAEHRNIVKALRARDPVLSYSVSFAHVAAGKKRMLDALDRMATPTRQRA